MPKIQIPKKSKFFFAWAERSETFTTLGRNRVFIVNLKFQTVSLTQKKFRVFWGLNFCHFLKTDSGQLKPPFLTCSDFRYTFGPLPVYFRSTSGYINFSKNTTNQLEPLFKLSITSGLLPLKFRLLPVHFRLLQIFKNTLTIARTPFLTLH